MVGRGQAPPPPEFSEFCKIPREKFAVRRKFCIQYSSRRNSCPPLQTKSPDYVPGIKPYENIEIGLLTVVHAALKAIGTECSQRSSGDYVVNDKFLGNGNCA